MIFSFSHLYVKMFFRFRNYESKLIHSIINLEIINIATFYPHNKYWDGKGIPKVENLKEAPGIAKIIPLQKYKRLSEWYSSKYRLRDSDDTLHNLSTIFSSLKIDSEETTEERIKEMYNSIGSIVPLKTQFDSLQKQVSFCVYMKDIFKIDYDGLYFTHKCHHLSFCGNSSTAIYDIMVLDATYAFIDTCDSKFLNLKPICGTKKNDEKSTFILPEFTKENPLIIPCIANHLGLCTDGYIVCKRIEFSAESKKKLNTVYSMQIAENSCISYIHGYPRVHRIE